MVTLLQVKYLAYVWYLIGRYLTLGTWNYFTL